MSELTKALAKAQAEFPTIEKNRRANAGSYSYAYADITDVIKAVVPVLEKHGLSFTQPYNVLPTGQQVLETQLRHSSGEVVTSQLLMPDPSKIKPQDVGAITTYFRRFALSAMLGIAADEDTDGPKAGAKPDPKPTAKAQEPAKAASSLPKPVAKPGSLPAPHQGREAMMDYKVSAAQLKRLRTIQSKAGIPDESVREMIGKEGFESSKDLTKAPYDRICNYMESLIPKV